MAINIGGKSYQIRIGSGAPSIICIGVPMISGISFLTADNFILQDSNGAYLTAKESE